MVTEKDREALHHNGALGRKHGVPARLVDAKEARERVPGLNTEGAVAFAFEEDAGYGDGYGSTIAFARRAKGGGATTLPKTPATGAEPDNPPPSDEPILYTRPATGTVPPYV